MLVISSVASMKLSIENWFAKHSQLKHDLDLKFLHHPLQVTFGKKRINGKTYERVFGTRKTKERIYEKKNIIYEQVEDAKINM